MSTDYTTMPAGPEMDAAVAEALGWTEVERRGYHLNGIRPGDLRPSGVPNYSGRVELALAALAPFALAGVNVNTEWDADGEFWWVRLQRMGDPGRPAIGAASGFDGLPLAICRAVAKGADLLAADLTPGPQEPRQPAEGGR